ncbi:MAG: hypothetical protein MI717_07075, partial [Spirochaetales bacterium]|nr:hypothetical protein [Spirochaetales bacterium]
MRRQRGSSKHSGAARGHGDSSSSAVRMSLGASGLGSVDAGTPRRFLCGDMGDPAAAARSDSFPTWAGPQRAEPEGP